MRIIQDSWVEEVQDVMVTIELALWFNAGKNKHSIVRRTCNKIKRKYSTDINLILSSWSTGDSYDKYDSFMTKAGL